MLNYSPLVNSNTPYPVYPGEVGFPRVEVSTNFLKSSERKEDDILTSFVYFYVCVNVIVLYYEMYLFL